MDVLQQITLEFQLNPTHAQNIVNLIDEGNTIPFIARYRVLPIVTVASALTAAGSSPRSALPLAVTLLCILLLIC